jgi:hypothetical protein
MAISRRDALVISGSTEARRAAPTDCPVPVRQPEHQAITEIMFGTPSLPMPPLPA